MNYRSHTPVFSVVVPTYNRAHLLPRAVQSVLSQTYRDFELLVVDDASRDDFSKQVEAFTDSRVTYIRRERNGGNAATRNTGIRQAKGQYIAFLDDDDEYLPEFLEKTYEVLCNLPQSVGFSWCGIRRVRDTPSGERQLHETLWKPQFRDREHTYLSFLHSRKIGTDCGLTVRRTCFDTVGMFDESLRKAVDTDLLIRLAREYDFAVVPHVLVKIHDHAGPRVRTNSVYGAEAYEKIIEKHADTLRDNPNIRASKHYKTAWLFYHGGNYAKARQHLGKAISIRPMHSKYWGLWLMIGILGRWGPNVHRQLSSWKKAVFLSGGR